MQVSSTVLHMNAIIRVRYVLHMSQSKNSRVVEERVDGQEVEQGVLLLAASVVAAAIALVSVEFMESIASSTSDTRFSTALLMYLQQIRGEMSTSNR